MALAGASVAATGAGAAAAGAGAAAAGAGAAATGAGAAAASLGIVGARLGFAVVLVSVVCRATPVPLSPVASAGFSALLANALLVCVVGADGFLV